MTGEWVQAEEPDQTRPADVDAELEGESTSALQVRHSRPEGRTVVEVQGDLEDEDEDTFRGALFQSIEDSGDAEDVLLDMSGVTYLSEGALAVLIQALKAQRARGAGLRLGRPSPFVRKKLERTALLKFFPLDDAADSGEE